MMLVNHYFTILFFHFHHFRVSTFSNRMAPWIKKLIWQKLTGAPKNLGVHPFPNSVGHFGVPQWSFCIFEALKEGMIESKHLFCKSCLGSNNLGFDLKQVVRCCRRLASAAFIFYKKGNMEKIFKCRTLIFMHFKIYFWKSETSFVR